MIIFWTKSQFPKDLLLWTYVLLLAVNLSTKAWLLVLKWWNCWNRLNNELRMLWFARIYKLVPWLLHLSYMIWFFFFGILSVLLAACILNPIIVYYKGPDYHLVRNLCILGLSEEALGTVQHLFPSPLTYPSQTPPISFSKLIPKIKSWPEYWMVTFWTLSPFQ